MRVELGYYLDVVMVTDPCAFSLADIEKAANRVYWETGNFVKFWPITIEYNERTEWWEVYFIKPFENKEKE